MSGGVDMRGSADKTDEELWANAYHEAGHALVDWYLGRGLRKKGVTIVPNKKKGTAGACHSKLVIRKEYGCFNPSHINQMRAEIAVMGLMAGEIAQRRHNPRSVQSYQASGDRRQMDNLLTVFTYNQKEITAWITLLEIRTQNLFDNANIWRAVKALAVALMEKHTINGEEATGILSAGFREWE